MNNKKQKRPFFFKLYFLMLLFFLGIMILAHSCLTFRSTEAEQTKAITKYGQEKPTFFSYQYGDRNFHYTYVGDKEQPLVLFVHGSPGSSDNFTDYLADTSLSQLAQLISVDRAGFGYSDFGKAEESLAAQAAQLRPILEKHGVGKSILVGHSLGGPLIAQMAVDYPELVGGLVIIAGSIAPELEPSTLGRRIINFPLIRWLVPTSFRASNDEILPLKAELDSLLPRWKEITVPVTVIHGAKDRMVPVGNADFAKNKITNSQKLVIDIIPKGNHFIIWTYKDRCTEHIKALLE